MAAAQTTVQQYEPLRPPSAWSAEERRLVQQLTDRFDDLYSRFNRLRFEDLGAKLQKRLSDTEATLEVQADQIAAKVSEANYQTDLTITSDALKVHTTQIKDTTEQMASLVTDANGLSVRITTAESNMAQALNDYKTTQETIIRLGDEGITVGSSESNTSVLIASDRVAICDQYSNPVTTITDNNMDIENVSIRTQLTVGYVARVKLSDGSCGDKWIGA